VAGGGDGEQRDQHAGQQQRVEGQQQVGGQDAGQRADWFAVAQQQGQQGFGEGQALPERVRRSPPAPGVEGDPQRAPYSAVTATGAAWSIRGQVNQRRRARRRGGGVVPAAGLGVYMVGSFSRPVPWW